MFKYLKYKNKNLSIRNGIYYQSKKKQLCMIPVGEWILKEKKFIVLLNKKRREFNRFFINDIDNDISKTKFFFKKIISDKNMCLFLITLNFKSYQGVVGLKYSKKEIEIYFVLKLKKNKNMKVSLMSLLEYSRINFKVNKFIVKVLSKNKRAKKLYFQTGFRLRSKDYLRKIRLKNLNTHKICVKSKSNVSYTYETLAFKV